MMKNIKLFAMFIAGLSLAALATYAAPVAIEAAINSFTLYMNRILVTTTGGPDGQVVVDINNMDSSAALLVNSTTRGFLPPRLTTAQRDNINNPAKGLIIFNTDLGFHQSYNGPSGNQAEYWHGVGAACPSVSIVQIQDTQLDPMLQFGAGFYSVGNNGTDLTIKASQPKDLLGMATIAGVPFYVQGAIIIDGNNNRVLSAGERSLFDESKLYGTLYMTPSGLIPLNGNNMTVTKTTGRSILGGVVAENDDMFVYICGEFVTGCTDTDAENYDPQANLDDGSCTLPTQVDMYFASGSNAMYSASTGSNITFSSQITNALCADAVNSAVTVTATWNVTSGMSPSYMSTSSTYGSASIAGNTATWTIDPMYIGCSNLPLSVTLYNGALGEVTVDWSVAINGDTNTSNDTMAQYGEWTAPQQGGGGNYDYGVFSGAGASYSTAAGSSITATISPINVYDACMAGYGIRVVAQLPRSVTYNSSNGGMMGQMGTYDNMINTVTWNTTASDGMTCAYMASSAYNYSVNVSSAAAISDNITWTVSAANSGNTDSNMMNNSTTQSLTRSSVGQTGTSNSDIYIYDMGGTNGTAGSQLTSNAYISNSCSGNAENIVVTASRSTSSGNAYYVSSNNNYSYSGGTYDGMNTVTWNLGNIGACSSISFNMDLYSASPDNANISRSVSSTNDSNSMNNNVLHDLTWTEEQVGIDLQIVTPTGGGTGRAYNTPITGSIYIYSSGMVNAENVMVYAYIPAGTNYLGSNGNYDGMGTVSRNLGTAYTGGPFSVLLESQNPGYETTLYRNVTTTSNDTNPSNNTYYQPFGWDM